MNAAFGFVVFLALVPATGSSAPEIKPSAGARPVFTEAVNAHPFDMTAVYRWASPNTLDLATTVVAHRALRRFEVFLASYFEGFPAVFGYSKTGFVEATKSMGDWLAFPRDDAATAMIVDGRNLTDQQAIDLYQTYQKENTP